MYLNFLIITLKSEWPRTGLQEDNAMLPQPGCGSTPATNDWYGISQKNRFVAQIS
jgi:hypothetical protein